jgi:hypothetical protein
MRKGWNMTASGSPSFVAALNSDRAAADRAQKMGLYGWLIGRWEMDAVIHDDDGRKHTGRGQIHFGWVLEGRAIQDVWILPGFFYGTTLRLRSRQEDTGAAVRWRFTEITPNSFHWLGERSPDGGANWQLQAEFFARRVTS